jgi:tetratricopeptide (TPR) repeat protein
MASIDPYSPCPCGSGQKFKWCCHKVEAYAERAQRLLEAGQSDAALQAVAEGLRKEPGNAWLLTRQALIQLKTGRPEEAKQSVAAVLRKNPKHLGALVLLTRLTLESEGAAAGAAQFQRAMTVIPPAERKNLAPLARVVGVFLTESGDMPAALRHLKLTPELAGGEPEEGRNAVRLFETSPTISPWMKNDDALSPVPEGLSSESRERFALALGWAGEGLWSSAAAAFEALAADPATLPAAERNLGFCRLWLADDAAATAALRRVVARLGPTEEAVDLEALCQQVDGPSPDDQVDHIRLTWPLRDRQALLDALNADKNVHYDGTGPLDPDDESSPEVEEFALLDRPDYVQREGSAADGSGLSADQVSRVVGRVYVAAEVAVLETFDDGRLDALSERFTTLAGPSLAPAHPRTKELGKVARVNHALTWEWILPEEVSPEHARRLNREQGARLMRDVWPNTPMGFLGGRTPLQAAEAGDAEVPLRAAVFQLEKAREPWREGFDFATLRDRLRIRSEPEPDPEAVDVNALHLARLALVPAERLSDEKLAALYQRARRYVLHDAIERAARALVERPEAMERLGIESLAVYTDLVARAGALGRIDEAFGWVRRGRQADAATKQARNAPHWDMLELRLRAQGEPPETWVPELAAILDRYSSDAQANETLMLNLMEMGLLQMASSPDRPDDVFLDSRPLQMLLSEYGPRVTTASGRIGVSATKPEIWTPGSEAGAAGGLWTPGAGQGPAGGGEKRLIIPGR